MKKHSTWLGVFFVGKVIELGRIRWIVNLRRQNYWPL